MGLKSNHWREIKPVQGEHVKFHILNAQPFFLVIATVKTRPVLKTAWQGLSKKGYKKLEKVMWS